MRYLSRISVALSFAVLSVFGVGVQSAHAQATRTWVSGVGDDVNPCSRTAPCKTFAGAISKTAAGGEINCLDPGAFGTVTITKAMSIICDGMEAGVLATGTTGVIVNAGATDVVILSGLDIQGAGSGLNGIRFIAGAQLIVRNTTIGGFRGSNASGITFLPSAASQLFVDNVSITDSGQGTGSAILIRPPGGSVRATLNNVRAYGNQTDGLVIDGSLTGDFMFITVSGSELTGNGRNGIGLTSGSNAARLLLSNSTVSNNVGIGLTTSGGTAQMRVSSSRISYNATGVSVLGGQIFSYGDNLLGMNGADGAFTAGSPIPKS